jgi:hypothetical protein
MRNVRLSMKSSVRFNATSKNGQTHRKNRALESIKDGRVISLTFQLVITADGDILYGYKGNNYTHSDRKLCPLATFLHCGPRNKLLSGEVSNMFEICWQVHSSFL